MQDNVELYNLIKKIAANDNDALATFYSLTEKQVFAFAYATLKNAEDSNDVKQDVFIKVKSYASNFDGKNAIGWLYAITKNTSLNLIKKRKRETVNVDDIAVKVEDVYDEEGPALKALKTLSDIEQKVVIYHLYLGYKHAETAKLLKLPLTTVKFKYISALKKLQKKVASNE